jgi:hypothetical protein
MRPEAAIVVGMADLGFSCRETITSPQASPPIEGSLCTPATPRSGITLVGVIERDLSGRPRVLGAKGKAEAGAGPTGRATVESTIAEIAGLAFPDQADAAAATAWVRSVVPTAEETTNESTEIGGLELRLEYATQPGYLLHIEVPRS